MPTVIDLKQSCAEPWEREGQGKPFRHEVKSAEGGKVRVTVFHNPDEKCWELYVAPELSVTLYIDPVRWEAILTAALAKCKEVNGRLTPGEDR